MLGKMRIENTKPIDLRYLADKTGISLAEALDWFDRNFENGYIGYVVACVNDPDAVTKLCARMIAEMN